MSFCTECGAPAGSCQHTGRPAGLTASVRPSVSAGWSPQTISVAVVALTALAVSVTALLAPAWRDRSDESTPIAATVTATPILTAAEVADLRSRLDALEDVADETSAAVVDLQSDDSTEEMTIQQIATRGLRSVVTVETPYGLGTGFAIEDPSGDIFIITNYHVVRPVWDSGGRTVAITRNGSEAEGRIANVSVANDLAAIETATHFPPLNTDRREPGIGDPVVVIGSPYGLDGTVVTGIISAIRTDAIQFSAPVSPGNSGGPLIAADGSVIGVVVAKVSTQDAEGLSFAIPMDVVCQVVVAC